MYNYNLPVVGVPYLLHLTATDSVEFERRKQELISTFKTSAHVLVVIFNNQCRVSYQYNMYTHNIDVDVWEEGKRPHLMEETDVEETVFTLSADFLYDKKWDVQMTFLYWALEDFYQRGGLPPTWYHRDLIYVVKVKHFPIPPSNERPVMYHVNLASRLLTSTKHWTIESFINTLLWCTQLNTKAIVTDYIMNRKADVLMYAVHRNRVVGFGLLDTTSRQRDRPIMLLTMCTKEGLSQFKIGTMMMSYLDTLAFKMDRVLSITLTSPFATVGFYLKMGYQVLWTDDALYALLHELDPNVTIAEMEAEAVTPMFMELLATYKDVDQLMMPMSKRLNKMNPAKRL
jgi:hypothetical protein